MNVSRVIPITAGSLIAATILSIEGLSRTTSEFGLFVTTALIANALYVTTVLSAMYYLTTRRSPLKFFANMSPAIFIAFATRSSYVPSIQKLIQVAV